MAANGRAGIDRSGDRDKSLEMALAQIERQFGKGSVMRLGEGARAPVEVIPTGSIALDVALGIGGLPRGRVVEIYGPEGSGKALALDTPIPTPKGWTAMGELSPGQEIFAGDGSLTQVTFTTPVMTGHECFRVRFSDGTEIIADADHQWVTTTLWGRTERWSPAVVTTREMAATVRARDGHALNHAIPTCGPLEYPAQELPVAPYTLGAWLGDGTTGSAAQLRKVGVLDEKHIPASYLHGSVAQRLALLQGLMDTDGTVSTGGSGTGRGSGAAMCEFSVVGERLARDVYELLLGLGIKVTFRSAPAVLNGRQTGVRYRLGFQTNLPVFRLPRKASRLAPLRTRRATLRYVTAVEPVDSVPVRCIQVDHPSHTYLAGRECVPTHNTTVALHSVANVQKAGGIAAFIDAEHALDPEYAKKIGVDTDALLVSQPDTGEQALEIADMLIRSGALGIVVIDSVAALVPRAEIEGEMGDSHVGLQARLMSQALRKLTGALSQSRTTAVFINQLREKVGVLFGSPETTTGGRALKFYSSVRLDVRRIETLKDGTDAVGNRIRVKVVKNKMSPPFRQAEVDLLFGLGISREGGLIDLGVEQGIVRKSGAWYTYEGDQLGQGKENARNFLKDNPDLADAIEKRIKDKLGVGVTPAAEEAGAGDSAGAGNPAGSGPGASAAAPPPANGGPGAAAGRGPGAARGAASARLAPAGRRDGTE
jgi:recombination protein RecA